MQEARECCGCDSLPATAISIGCHCTLYRKNDNLQVLRRLSLPSPINMSMLYLMIHKEFKGGVIWAMRKIFLLTLVCFSVVHYGCDQEKKPGSDIQQEKKDLSGQTQSSEDGDVLRFYNWEDYTGTGTIEKFKEQNGIDVHLETFADDEAILGALQSGAVEADLIVVSQSLALEMLKAKLLQPIDYTKIPNSTYLKTEFIPQPDNNGQRYWVPYLWGTTGIVVNTKFITDDYRTWAVLWEPRYKGKVAMLNNGFEVTAAAAKKMGYSVNPTVRQLDEVSTALFAQKELVAGYFSSVKIIELMRNESIWAAQIYNGDGLSIADESEDIQFVNPREGMALWIDVLIIPRNADNPQLAHAFIDFIHTPEILGAIASEYWFASTNSGAEQYMSPEVLEADEVYPPEGILEKSELFNEMGGGESVRRRVQIWSKLMSE